MFRISLTLIVLFSQYSFGFWDSEVDPNKKTIDSIVWPLTQDTRIYMQLRSAAKELGLEVLAHNVKFGLKQKTADMAKQSYNEEDLTVVGEVEVRRSKEPSQLCTVTMLQEGVRGYVFVDGYSYRKELRPLKISCPQVEF
ncbi:MAG: hypothetical protein IPK04_07660 [Bdellovibrionales bacterium]|nr:hypothetical protein [Bdellovibrionales bacterium]